MTARNVTFTIVALLICCLGIGIFISSTSFFTQEESEPERNQEEFGHLSLDKKWQGDYDGMAERRLIRVLVVSTKWASFLIPIRSIRAIDGIFLGSTEP